MMTTEQLQTESALSLLVKAKEHVKTAANILTMHGVADQASMTILAVLDAIDRAHVEVQLRGNANGQS